MGKKDHGTRLTAAMLKERAKQLGASVCGIGDIERFHGVDAQHNPLSILPGATCVIGIGFAVPTGLYRAMDEGRQMYGYTTLGVKFIDEVQAEMFLLKMGAYIEDFGYDACLQRSVPNLQVQGSKATNPEVIDTYELVYAEAVSREKPPPDVILDLGQCAAACGIGEVGMSGHILNDRYGPYIRYCFIITDAPLEVDSPSEGGLCDRCGACANACPGGAIGEDGLDTWQCAVYYKGAHESNPFMTNAFLQGHPERERILRGEKRFDSESARALYGEMDFLPVTQNGYAPCLCGRRCDVACYQHWKEMGRL